MRSRLPLLLPLALCVALPLAGCTKKKATAASTRKLGPVEADEYDEKNATGDIIPCYTMGLDSNNPIRICGLGDPSPDRKWYLLEAQTPAPGKFTEEGAPLPPGSYLLRQMTSNKVDAWNLGRLGAHYWLADGKGLLAVDTDEQHTTHIHVIDPMNKNDRVFDVPLAKTEEYQVFHAGGDSAVLLVEKVGVELAILVSDPLGNPDVYKLDIPYSKNAGAKKLWRRGQEQRARGEVWKLDATLASFFDWKGTDPTFEGSPLGPFDPLVDNKKK